MAFNNIIDVLFDIGEKKHYFKDLNHKTLLDYFKANYSFFLDNEIFRVNSNILDNKINYLTDSSIISKILYESKNILDKNSFIEFLESCNLSNNDSNFINDNLNNDLQGNSMINIMKKLIHTQSFSILKEYRESPQARKDITNKITNKNISSSILNPFLTLLAEKNSPSIRMELWQKFEMYFESGWGFNDLTKNDSKSTLVEKLKTIIQKINDSNDVIKSSEGLGKELLNTLSERITELGVPIHIKMEFNPINGSNIPVATILKDKEKYKHAFKSKKTMPSGFVDWAMPKFDNPKVLCCSIATSDETCNIENSEAFRYEYALRELSKNNDSGFEHIMLSFYSTSTFYDEYDLDENLNHYKPNKEIGQEFLSRFKIYKEQRSLLNIVPFFAMSHKISSNLKTGIYNPSQLMSYNFKILGAKSMIENSNDKHQIEELYKRCISVILNVFSQDKLRKNNSSNNLSDNLNYYYSDGKTLNMLNQLYNLITTSKDEFFESKKIFNILTNENTITSLRYIYSSIPENQNNEKQVNKNDFKTLIQSLAHMKNIGFNNFKKEQLKERDEFIKELNNIKNLTNLSKSIIHLNNLNDEIIASEKKLNIKQNLQEYINKPKKEKKLIAQQELIQCLMPYFDKRSKHYELFQKNTTLLDYSLTKYKKERSYVTAERHYELFSEYQKNKNTFLDDWRFKIKNMNLNEDNVIQMCFNFIKNLNEDNFHEYKLPNYNSFEKFNQLLHYAKQENIDSEESTMLKIILQIESLKKEKEIIIKSITEKYSNSDINFVLNKINLDISLFKTNKINHK